jgi:amidase
MDAAGLVFAGVARQAELVAAGEVTPRELVDACLERIQAVDPRLNAFRVVFAERARAEADALGERDGRPLYGVPIAVKDDMDVAGEPTCFGTSLLLPPAAQDSEYVRRLRAAGAIVLGKTHVPELTIWAFTESAAFGITRNPWNLDRTTGGSSGGSAAAVAGGLVGAATGSDGLGSIRIPAACCGLVGLKPQRGRVSVAPKTEPWHGLTHYGVLTRSVRDTALVLDAVSDRPPAEPFAQSAERAPGRLRIALSFKAPPVLPARISGEVRAAVEGVAQSFRDLGHEVVERDPDYDAVPFVRGLSRFFRGVHDDARATGAPERLERRTRAVARVGRLTPTGRVARSRAEEPAFTARIGRLFEDVDVLMTPVTAFPPHEVARFEGRGLSSTYLGEGAFVPFPAPWNLTGQPAMSIPAGFTADGVPLAVQLIGRPEDEATLLSLAAQLEAERGWPERRPPIS